MFTGVKTYTHKIGEPKRDKCGRT